MLTVSLKRVWKIATHAGVVTAIPRPSAVIQVRSASHAEWCHQTDDTSAKISPAAMGPANTAQAKKRTR